MSADPRQAFFTQLDVTTTTSTQRDAGGTDDVSGLLRQLVAGQDRQNELLEELVQQMGAGQRQRAAELNQWKQANPHLAQRCREAAEALGKVQTQFLHNVTEEISDNADVLMDGEFMLNEFVDRFGPRLAHLNGVLQVLSQLAGGTQPSESTR